MKKVLLFLVIVACGAGAVWYLFLRGPVGTWVIDEEATKEMAAETPLFRLATGVLGFPDLRLEIDSESTYVLWRTEGQSTKMIVDGTWKKDGAAILFSPSLGPGTYADGKLTIEALGGRFILKRTF